MLLLEQIAYGWLDWFEMISNGEIRLSNWRKLDGLSACPNNFRVATVLELEDELLNSY